MSASRSARIQADIRVGISGWRYAPWRKKFYPADLPQKNELHFASRAFNSVELNGSFYSLQRPERYRHWRQETPDGFVFSVKGGRYITHMKKLRDVETPLAHFFASGVLELQEKWGPILWQFPPSLPFSEERFKKFPCLEVVTAPFVYVRFHGSTEIYSSGYSDAELEYWAKRVRSWARGKQPQGAQRVSKKSPPSVASRDVYIYFDNDQKVEAPFNAGVLAKKLGLS